LATFLNGIGVMRGNRPYHVALAAALALAPLLAPCEGRAEDIFDFLFGPDTPPRAAHPPSGYAPRQPVKPREPVNASLRAVPPGADEGMGGGGFCVRTCDGYFFPLIKSAQASRQQSCEYACPSAPMELYEGASIEEARNRKGKKYSSLPAAFSFRDKTTKQCACNRPETSQAFFVRISRTDPTLRDGDVVMSKDGALVYHGSGLVPLNRASFVSSWERQRLRALLDRASRGRKHTAPRDAEASRDGTGGIRKEGAKPAGAPTGNPTIWVAPADPAKQGAAAH
jgi:hypothetical protein